MRMLFMQDTHSIALPSFECHGHFQDKTPPCGLAFSRPIASAIIAAFIVACILLRRERGVLVC